MRCCIGLRPIATKQCWWPFKTAHLSGTAIANKHELEGGNLALCGSFSHGCGLLWRGAE
jgi:hypothetical protein